MHFRAAHRVTFATLLLAALLGAAGSESAAAAAVDARHTANARPAETIVLAGGCFWGMEAVFESLKGVNNVVSGYAGGNARTAHYEMVSTGMTGHAESVEINFDPSQISLAQLLNVYFLVAHDPTQLNRQGPDEGSQYRSAIFYTSSEQKRIADAMMASLARQKVFSDRIVTQIVPLTGFYPAEGYHQHFVARNPDYPYVVFNDLPKLRHLRAQFPNLVKAHSVATLF